MTDIFKYTILEYFGSDGQKCGYCREIKSHTYGMWAHHLHSWDYQELINRGWRRSGAYLYKPKMELTCCPLYTIRCDAMNFQISKSQKKTIKKFIRFLENDIKANPNDLVDNELNDPKKNIKIKTVKPGQGMDPNKPPCRKAKLIRLEKKKLKEESSQSIKTEPSTSQNLVEQKPIKHVEEFTELPINKEPADLNLTNPVSEEDNHSQLNNILETDIGWLNIPMNGVHKLKIKLIHSNLKLKEFNDSLNESYEVYKKYQLTIHNDTLDSISPQQYLRFLVKSPLEETRKKRNSNDHFGTYHMHYILDNRIIAVGVLDILPQCVSSVYFYYDPDYNFLSLGTVAALLEIKLAQQLNKIIDTIKYYYMGYYIHSCPKMQYKAAYLPSYLLCPYNYTWVPFEISRSKIDISKCAKLSDEDVIDEFGEFEIEEVTLLKDHVLYKFGEYMNKFGFDESSSITEWANLIGTSTLKNSILKFDKNPLKSTGIDLSQAWSCEVVIQGEDHPEL